MNGFKIEYTTPKNKKEATWFTCPESSFCPSKTNKKICEDIVKIMFTNAHPESKIIAVTECTFEEFQKETENERIY